MWRMWQTNLHAKRKTWKPFSNKCRSGNCPRYMYSIYRLQNYQTSHLHVFMKKRRFWPSECLLKTTYEPRNLPDFFNELFPASNEGWTPDRLPVLSGRLCWPGSLTLTCISGCPEKEESINDGAGRERPWLSAGPLFSGWAGGTKAEFFSNELQGM